MPTWETRKIDLLELRGLHDVYVWAILRPENSTEASMAHLQIEEAMIAGACIYKDTGMVRVLGRRNRCQNSESTLKLLVTLV